MMMDMREQLIAYLEGTLPYDERVLVARRLQTSERWQAEWTRVQSLHDRLRYEMPLLGQPEPGQLQALLPDIMARRQPRSLLWNVNLNTLWLACSLLVMLVLIPLLLQSSSASAMVSEPRNIPLSTYVSEDDGTIEARFQEIDHMALVANRISYAASPVPMPGATLEPSREAPGK